MARATRLKLKNQVRTKHRQQNALERVGGRNAEEIDQGVGGALADLIALHLLEEELGELVQPVRDLKTAPLDSLYTQLSEIFSKINQAKKTTVPNAKICRSDSVLIYMLQCLSLPV